MKLVPASVLVKASVAKDLEMASAAASVLVKLVPASVLVKARERDERSRRAPVASLRDSTVSALAGCKSEDSAMDAPSGPLGAGMRPAFSLIPE